MNRTPIQLLLAEDSTSDADLILASLAKVCQAEAIHIVHDGIETLDFVFCRGAYADRLNEPPLRAIFLDLKLPRVDGFEVLRQIKSNLRTSSIPVVLLTSSNIDLDVARGYLLGANSYVQKPVDFEQFRDTIRQLGLYWLSTNETAPAKHATAPARP